MKTEFTDKEKEEFLKKIAQQKETATVATILAILSILVTKKIVTQEEVNEYIKVAQEAIIEKWKENKEEMEKLDSAMMFDSIFKSKNEDKK